MIPRLAALALLAWCASGCASKNANRYPTQRPAWQPTPAWSAQGTPSPYGAPIGETRDPWWVAAPGPVVAPPHPPAAPSEGPFLLLIQWGPAESTRAPEVAATVARLGGVPRAHSLWEVTPQPGGGLAMVASALEKALCAEDVVVVWRARGAALDRSEFAGHQACPAPTPAAATPAPASDGRRPPPRKVDPLYDRF